MDKLHSNEKNIKNQKRKIYYHRIKEHSKNHFAEFGCEMFLKFEKSSLPHFVYFCIEEKASTFRA